jgi:bifunctional DNA-binding transcriptional regulator/antitoxin component of YhaV-PrlF toxin-antitoxin module
MNLEEMAERRVFHARVDAAGRMVLPADSRLRSQVGPGEVVVVSEGPDDTRLMTVAEAVGQAQAYVRSVIPADVDLVQELLDERRAEAVRE